MISDNKVGGVPLGVPALYMNLYMGLKEPGKHMGYLGEQGPVLGPFEAYTPIPRMQFIGFDRKVYNLSVLKNCIYYDGVFYGACEIITVVKDWVLSVYRRELMAEPDENKFHIPCDIRKLYDAQYQLRCKQTLVRSLPEEEQGRPAGV